MSVWNTVEPRSPVSHPGLRLSTQVIQDPNPNESNYALEHDASVPYFTLCRRAYNGSNWETGEYVRKMWWPDIVPYSQDLFLQSARMLECGGSADPEYDTKYVRVLVTVPVGGQTRVRAGQFETNESTCVCINILLDRKEFRIWPLCEIGA